MSGARITILPLVPDTTALLDLLGRMAWGVGGAAFQDCVIYVADKALCTAEWRVPELLDPAIAACFAALRARVHLVANPSKDEVLARIEASDYVVFVEDPPQWNLLGDDEWTEALKRKKIFRADPARTRQEFGNWVELNFHLRGAEREAEIERCRARFAQILEATGRVETAYCLATGPSLAMFKETNFDGALSIVCNSAILDEELMAWVRPKFLVFADPIFHFGPSKYAAEFRRRLRESCARHDYTIIVPMRYYGLLTDAMPELRARTIGIPSDKPNGFSLDLSTEFRVFTTANILTYLMLPLASTLARRVYMLGCDGRPLNEDNYFWQHNKKTQINDQMDNIRLAHPGFFAIDYNDYYRDHCRQLEEMFAEGEKMGREYGSVTPSFIPALRSRPANLPRMLVIDFTELGAHNATGQLKATLFKSWPGEKVLQVRPLNTRDGSFFRLHSQPKHPAFSEAKLTRDDVLREVTDFAPQLVYFRPTDSPPEFLELGLEIVRHLGVPVISHIMDDWPERLRAEDPEKFRRIEPSLLAVLECSSVRLSISDAMSAAFSDRYGLDFTAVANGIDPAEWQALPAPPADGPLVIRYCGGLTEDMSLASVERVARAVSALSAELPVRFEMYALPAASKLAGERFKGLPGVTVLPSVDWADYPRLLATAGATLIAYNFDERTRIYTQYSMANKLPECLAAGSPLIVYGPGTIATVPRARELGAALVVTEPDGIESALRSLVAGRAAYRERALRARERALAELDAENVRRIFQERVLEIEAARPRAAGIRALLGPYTRLQLRHLEECDVAAGFFSEFASASILVAVGEIPRERLEPFLARDWTVVAVRSAETLRSRAADFAPKFGKNVVAVVLCHAAELSRIEPLHIVRTAGLLVLTEAGSTVAGLRERFDAGSRAVWSESYPSLGVSVKPDFRELREIAPGDGIEFLRSGVLVLLDPEILRVRRGAGDAVTAFRRACSASMGRKDDASSGLDEPAFGERLYALARDWTAAIGRMNVRWALSHFFRERLREFRDRLLSVRRGRLIVWK